MRAYKSFNWPRLKKKIKHSGIVLFLSYVYSCIILQTTDFKKKNNFFIYKKKKHFQSML